MRTQNQGVPAQPVPPREPTQGQIDARTRAKQAGAKSLFDTSWCGQAIGSHSWRSISAIAKDGYFARRLLEEIGPISEGDKDRSVRELLGDSEERIRKVWIAAGRKAAKVL